MGRILSIGIYADPDRLPEVIASLYERLLANGNFIRSGIYKWELEEERKREQPTTQQVRNLVAEILPSTKMLSIEVSYNTPSRVTVDLDLQVYGINYLRGAYIIQRGPVRLSFAYNDFTYTPMTEEQAWQESQLPFDPQKRRESDRAAAPYIWELFLYACQANDSSIITGCGEVEHAAMYREATFGSPTTCSAIFHKDLREFGRDLARIYLEYERGVHPSQTLKADTDLWAITPPQRDRQWSLGLPGKEDVNNYPPWPEYNESHLQEPMLAFLNSLTEEKVKRLASLSAEEIREVLARLNSSNIGGHHIENDLGPHADESRIIVRDFGDCGLAVLSRPLTTVWYAYKYIADHAQ